MVEGEPTPTTSPLLIRERAYVESEHDGIWFPEPRVGAFVSKGVRLGVLTDFFGDVVMEARSPESGMLLVMLATPLVNVGEMLAVIAKVGPDGNGAITAERRKARSRWQDSTKTVSGIPGAIQRF